MSLKRPLSALVVSAVVIASPGPFAWEASAQVVRGPAPVAAGAVGAWGAAVGRLATAVQTSPALSARAPGLAPVLGRLRLEMSLRPRSQAQAQAALSFVARLPDAAADPKAFAALPPAERVQIIDAAIAATSAELEPVAAILLNRAAVETLSQEERAELDRVAARWFYLAPETAAAVKTAAAARAGAALSLAGRLARALTREKVESPAAVVHSELVQLFTGAAVVTENAQTRPGRLVPGLLAPYVARALDEAEVRALERGAPEGGIAKRIIENHVGLFGRVADRGLFDALRARGEWTDFVAAVSLRAAEKLGTMGEEGRLILAKAGEGDALRLAIPDWHPLFGRYASIAEWLTDAHGKPDDSKDLTGMPFFTALGIPVRIEHSLWPALILAALQFSSLFLTPTPGFGGLGRFAQGLATTALLYLSVLGHEFGHAAAARLFGIRTKKIILNFLGGGAEIVRGFRQALPEFVIALAGPIVSALLGASALGLAALLHNPVVTPVLLITGQLNLILAALNMLPLFPMDGARVLRAALTRLFGSYRATRLVGLVSAALSLFLMANGVNVYLLGGSVVTALIRFAFGAYFLSMSKEMAVHPGTTTIDEKASDIRAASPVPAVPRRAAPQAHPSAPSDPAQQKLRAVFDELERGVEQGDPESASRLLADDRMLGFLFDGSTAETFEKANALVDLSQILQAEKAAGDLRNALIRRLDPESPLAGAGIGPGAQSVLAWTALRSPEKLGLARRALLEWETLEEGQRGWIVGQRRTEELWRKVPVMERASVLRGWAREESLTLRHDPEGIDEQALAHLLSRSNLVAPLLPGLERGALEFHVERVRLLLTARRALEKAGLRVVLDGLDQRAALPVSERLEYLSAALAGRPEFQESGFVHELESARMTRAEAAFSDEERRLLAERLVPALLEAAAVTRAGTRVLRFYAGGSPPALRVRLMPGNIGEFNAASRDISLSEEFIQGWLRAESASLPALLSDPAALRRLAQALCPAFVHEATHQMQHARRSGKGRLRFFTQDEEIEAFTAQTLHVLELSLREPDYRRQVRRDDAEAADRLSEDAALFGRIVRRIYSELPSFESFAASCLRLAGAMSRELARREAHPGSAPVFSWDFDARSLERGQFSLSNVALMTTAGLRRTQGFILRWYAGAAREMSEVRSWAERTRREILAAPVQG